MSEDRVEPSAAVRATHRTDAPVEPVADLEPAYVDQAQAGGSAGGRGRCRGCEGRGWRVATSVDWMRLEETVTRLATRPCPDCLGGPLLNPLAV